MDYPLSQAASLDLKDGKFTDGVPGLYAASVIPSKSFNDVIDEILAVQVEGNVAKDENNKTQLKTAIKNMIEARVGDYVADTGVANAYVIVLNPPIVAPAHGMEAKFRVTHANTTNSTLDAGGGPKPLVKNTGQPTVDGDLPVDVLVSATFDGPTTSWRINGLVTSQALSRAAADALYLGQAGSQITAIAGGTADALTAVFTPAVTALANQRLYVRAAAVNATTSPTFAPNGIPAATIVKGGNQPLLLGDIAGAGHWLELIGDQTLGKWVLLNPAKGLDSSQIGKLFDWPYGSSPDDGILCNGAALSSSGFPALFAAAVKTLSGATVTIGAGATFTWASHPLYVNAPVKFTSTGILPTGVAFGTTLYVISAGFSANSFQLSTTIGGAAITTSGTQSGVHTAIHAPYGCANDLSTFNVPNIPAGYTTVQAASNEGVTTIGQVVDHTHGLSFAQNVTTGTPGGSFYMADSGTGSTTGVKSPAAQVGGAANLAAGLSVRKYIRYK